MATPLLPPQPIDENPTSPAWVDWYTKLRYTLNVSGLQWDSIIGIPPTISGIGGVSFNANEGLYATSPSTFSTFALPSFSRGVIAQDTAPEWRDAIDAGSDISEINTQNASYTTVLEDKGKSIYHTSGTPHTWTIAAEDDVDYPIGTVISFINDDGGGDVTIAIDGGDVLIATTTGNTGSRTLAENGRASAIKVASERWQISGAELT